MLTTSAELWDGVLRIIKVSLSELLREELKKVSPVYWLGTKYRCFEQSRRIEKEQLYYEKKAEEIGLSRDFTIEKIKCQLKEKLLKRNIYPKQKSKKNLHIVFASRLVPWVRHNIVPALDKFANVTTYHHSEYGFDPAKVDWLDVREKMNAHFIDFLKQLHKGKPIDLILSYLSGYQIDCDTIKAINNMGIVTASFHYDDRLSFRGEFEAGRWAGPVDVCKVYDLNLTQAPESLVKYRVEGGIVMLWPLAANQDFFYPRDVPFHYDVSFIGSAHGFRKPFIDYLRKNGVNVDTFGAGWSNGFIPDEKVPEIFSSSRINLNFGDIAYTNYQCGKCRDFEIPMSGGLMLTTHNKHLSDYFELDKDIFTFRIKEECLSQIHRLLSDKSLSETARRNARERALKEHTWERRIKSLLEVIGFI
jgi:hypothetical protein